MAVLIFDPARGNVDRDAKQSFANDVGRFADPLVIDVSESAIRALAARFHPSTTRPTMVLLTPAGVVLEHVEGPRSSRTFVTFIHAADEDGVSLDREYAKLRDDVVHRPSDVPARMALADFLLAHTNDREAIPHLQFVSDDTAADVPTRVRAWVALGRAHLWVGEPEKARHAAQALIATLGPTTPDAVAGGNLVRGLQDVKAKRYDRAHDELSTAKAASPTSPYGTEAADLLKTLPPAR